MIYDVYVYDVHRALIVSRVVFLLHLFALFVRWVCALSVNSNVMQLMYEMKNSKETLLSFDRVLNFFYANCKHS